MSAKAKRILAKLNDPKHRARLVEHVNLLDQDEPAKVGGGDNDETSSDKTTDCLHS